KTSSNLVWTGKSDSFRNVAIVHKEKRNRLSLRRFSIWIFGMLLLLMFLTSTSCRSGSGAFYEWCEKRGFPRICKKYF
ncbi:MAG TPA: hypothetical protein QF623_14330, partial [SAR324 cluster bacterium]|nr:hypothetical protein [SAR324 cluster bacterium]